MDETPADRIGEDAKFAIDKLYTADNIAQFIIRCEVAIDVPENVKALQAKIITMALDLRKMLELRIATRPYLDMARRMVMLDSERSIWARLPRLDDALGKALGGKARNRFWLSTKFWKYKTTKFWETAKWAAFMRGPVEKMTSSLDNAHELSLDIQSMLRPFDPATNDQLANSCVCPHCRLASSDNNNVGQT